jgi:type I restriction enzyme S subunit
MSETLESIARALFQSWFVDFDPVRAKSEGRDTGLPKHIADLFPDGFEESELGEIPKGWTCAGIGDWTTALSGGTPSKRDPSLWNGDIPWISPKVMTSIHADEADSYVTDRALGNGTRLAPAYATLVMVRGMGLHNEVRVSQARRHVAFNQDVKALVAKGIEPSLLLFALLNAQAELLGRIETSGHGTGKLTSDVLFAHPITMPTAPIQNELARGLGGINERIEVLRDESRILADARDTLLPRLITGEFRVRDAERFTSANG